MIRLGLRLTLNGGRESLVRLAVTAFAVALGVGMLLIALAGMNGLAGCSECQGRMAQIGAAGFVRPQPVGTRNAQRNRGDCIDG